MKHNGIDTGTISETLISYFRDELENPNIEYSSPLLQLQGGYETTTYRFRLKGVGEELSDYLVLRLYPQAYGSQNALWESTVQTVLAGEGYPVAKVHFVCTDMSVLGGAFFVMDCIPGQLLMSAPPESVPGLLGKAHAELHLIDPGPLIRALREHGIDGDRYSSNSRYDWLESRADELRWIHECVDWLIANRPPEPEHLVVCHGDFHPINIMVDAGKITGVLDWPGFAIADPVLDVANTIVLSTIPAKHLTALMEGFPAVDWDLFVQAYLSAYRSRRQLDSTNLDYYRARRCAMALMEGFEGHKVWQQSPIVNDLVGTIHGVTGIQVAAPV